MDSIDRLILSELTVNGRATAATISQKVNLTVPAVLERMRKLSRSGVIQGYTVKINRQRVGLGLLAFVQVRLEGSADIPAFRARMTTYACVLECHHTAGAYDYLLKVALADTAALETFLTDELKAGGGVAETNTMIVLTTLKEECHGSASDLG